MNFNILCSNQYGFSKNHSTALTLINLPDKISTVFDRGEFFVGIFLDLSKAFNTVNHVILLINSNIRVFMAYSTGHRHCSITYVFHVWKSAILHANSTGKTLVKHSCKKYTRKDTGENTRKLGKFACKTLHADCYNLRVFGLCEFLYRWLSECSCTCAGGFNLLA